MKTEHDFEISLSEFDDVPMFFARVNDEKKFAFLRIETNAGIMIQFTLTPALVSRFIACFNHVANTPHGISNGFESYKFEAAR